MRRCSAQSCKRTAISGEERCSVHGGSASNSLYVEWDEEWWSDRRNLLKSCYKSDNTDAVKKIIGDMITHAGDFDD